MLQRDKVIFVLAAIIFTGSFGFFSFSAETVEFTLIQRLLVSAVATLSFVISFHGPELLNKFKREGRNKANEK